MKLNKIIEVNTDHLPMRSYFPKINDVASVE